MKPLATATALAAALLAGCATKTRSIDLAGMYVSEAGTLAIGSVEVQASPVGVESAAIRYTEDTAWLSPSTKTHAIKILLTGTNAVSSAGGIVSSICQAFTATAAGADPCRCKAGASSPSADATETATEAAATNGVAAASSDPAAETGATDESLPTDASSAQ